MGNIQVHTHVDSLSFFIVFILQNLTMWHVPSFTGKLAIENKVISLSMYKGVCLVVCEGACLRVNLSYSLQGVGLFVCIRYQSYRVTRASPVWKFLIHGRLLRR